MSNSANRLVANTERRHRNGVKKYKRMIEEHGSWAIGRVPLELREDVMKADSGELADVVTIRQTELTARLLEVVPVRTGLNPLHELEARMKEGSGNDIEVPSMLSKMASVYPVRSKITLKKPKGS